MREANLFGKRENLVESEDRYIKVARGLMSL